MNYGGTKKGQSSGTVPEGKYCKVDKASVSLPLDSACPREDTHQGIKKS